ncbi:uncharacterized protein LOC117747873 isoform X2 [Cyclopterus lumpus]|nr:uncharacterized protein LOC117747873 isoform X2 [Cyclopterus lumpus]
MWVEVKIKPLLKSINKQFLSCLSTERFSCSTYQTLVRELSNYYSEMNPTRQQWIYSFFMHPFLSGDRVAGCVLPQQSSEEWLMKNFGAFRAAARLKDLSALNMLFSGLEVLHLLSPAQKAELLLRPEVAGLDNGNLSLVFHSLSTGGPPPTAGPGEAPHWTTPGGGHNWTTPGYPYTYPPHATYNPNPPPSPQNSLRQVVNGFAAAFKPVGSFVHDFVSFTQERDMSKVKSTTLTQFLLNWTLAELADAYRPQVASVVPAPPKFDVSDVEDWYQQVVMPVLRRFLPDDGVHQNVKLAFHQLFYLDRGAMPNETSEVLDVCSITLNNRSCGLTSAVANVAKVLHCAAGSELTLSEQMVMSLIGELTQRLHKLILELLASNLTEVASDFQQIFREADPPSSLTREHLQDPAFIRLWFQVKLAPLLPDVPRELLSCLSTKNFSCPAYQTIVAGFSEFNLRVHPEDDIYNHFLFPFLLNHNTSDPQCVSSANNSTEWLTKNLGDYVTVPSIADFYRLNTNFSGLEVLRLLTPQQTAEMLLSPLPTPPEKDVVIDRVFDFLLESPGYGRFTEVLRVLRPLLDEIKPPCDVYKQIFERLYAAIRLVPRDVEPDVWTAIKDLRSAAPDECLQANATCRVIPYNDTNLCRGVSSSDLLNTSVGVPCSFSLETYACAQLENFTANQLVSLLKCNLPGNSSNSKGLWKMLLTKLTSVLDPALDLLADMSTTAVVPSASAVLDVIGEIRVTLLTDEQLTNSSVIELWFSDRLGAFLTFPSGGFLLCLSSRNLSCQSYQQILQEFVLRFDNMTENRQNAVAKDFILPFLSRPHSGPGCSSASNGSAEWLMKNLGSFSRLLSFRQLLQLNPDFQPSAALPQLTVRQLAEVSATPGQLASPVQVTTLMKHVPDEFLAAFFDDLSPAIVGNESNLPSEVRSAMLQVVFDRANLSDPSVADSEVSLWLRARLRPLLVNLSPAHVAPFFRILSGRNNCSIEQQGVGELNSTISSLSEDTKKEIYDHIVQTLKGPTPLTCYQDDNNQSFYSFLERSFLGFQFPNLTTFLSLMPRDRMHQLLNSVPPSALGDFLRRPDDVVDDDAALCVIYDNYEQTATFLETESLPEGVRRLTLPCVWPVALGSSERSEVSAWFDRRLQNYLVFLTKGLIGPDSTRNASCLAFQKLVSVLGEYNYTGADFVRSDVFDSIRAYLTSATAPRCYDASDPELNSTAWFAEYVGPFMPFLTLGDLQTFGSAKVIQVFAVNPLNIALLDHAALPANLTNYYTELVYRQDANFNPLLLPLLCQCVAPGLAFSQLTAKESMIVLQNLTAVCVSLDPQVSAALAGNLGNDIDAGAIAALGNQSTGMSTGQIKSITPQQMLASLGTLGNVTGWNEGQAKAIVQSLMSSGAFEINSTTLLTLGSLVAGVPAKDMGAISGAELLAVSKDPSFLEHIRSAPLIVQQTFVSQIISADSDNEAIIQNVPDEMASQIPRALLQGFSNNASVIKKLNQKKWNRQQVELFFDVMAVESATDALGGPNNLSSSVLQGFTCTGVRAVKAEQIKKLIKACRRKGENKVPLEETQLTCMYNHIKGDPDVAAFDLYPPDVMLYYDYSSLVPAANCRSYFEELADADFSVFSPTLSHNRTALFVNAASCLGIANTSLTEDNISVLGNMCCTLNSSYIQNSDPSILDRLKDCPDLTGAQAAAVEALLSSGETQYGAPSTWNESTLEDLGMLPLYLTSTFYENFDKITKQNFLRYFLEVLQSNGVDRQKRRSLKKEMRKSIINRSKRSTVNECTVGAITQVTISDDIFPFDYDDITQFDSCLNASTVRDNLEAITEKVDQEEYLRIVLRKLREIYSTVPEDQVQLLGPASRVATAADVDAWAVTQIDTLASLMDSSNGPWDPSLAKAVVSKYLSHAGNELGRDELNAVGGANLCSLDVDVLNNISQQSIRDAGALTLNNCTAEKKRELFAIAERAFAPNTRSTVSAASYSLTQPYIGGADSDYVKRLAASNINMDMATFTSLDENLVQNLTVGEVRGLLGTNLPNLQSYQDNPLVKAWIGRQSQLELETLGVGIVGGRVDPTNPTTDPTSVTAPPTTNPSVTAPPTTNPSVTAPPTTNPSVTAPPTTNPSVTAPPTTNPSVTAPPTTNPSVPAPSTTNPSVPAPSTTNPSVTSPSTTNPSVTAPSTTTSTTGNHGARFRADAGFSSLALLALLIASSLA